MPRINFLALVLFAAVPVGAAAHSVTPNQAIQAATIAELFITPTELRLELEIGAPDLGVFRDLVTVSTQLTDGQRRFFRRELVIKTDDRSDPLEGRIVAVENRRRRPRDPITGTPLPAGDGVPVTFVEVRYALPTRPTQIYLSPPTGPDGPRATIGIVVRHGAVPVNDFDFFAMRETLRLDWDDPWKSRFRSPRLKRYYTAPVSTFLYVGAHEVRLEIVARVRTLADWHVVRSFSATVQVPEAHAEVQQLARFLGDHAALTIDGVPVRPVLENAQLLRLTLARIEAVNTGEGVAVDAALVGVVFVHPVPELPRSVALAWDRFDAQVPTVPTSINSEQTPTVLTATSPVLNWTNMQASALADRPPLPPPARALWNVPIPSVVCGGLFIGWLAASGRRRWAIQRYVLLGVFLVGCAVLLWPFGRYAVPDPLTRSTPVSDAEAAQITQRLLETIYHAFDYRGEEAIYDALAGSVSGDLLRQTYLEIWRTLDPKNQGARAWVENVAVSSVHAQPLASGPGFSARCRWTVQAAVSHWGHTHGRINQYEADLTVQYLDGAWKLTALKVLDEQQVGNMAGATPAVVGRP